MKSQVNKLQNKKFKARSKKIIILAVMTFAFWSCNNASNENTETNDEMETHHHEEGDSLHHHDGDSSHHQMNAVVYQCPMHEEITSDKPGTCSICGMDLEVKK